ncbi:Metallo-dependent phosphatase-like protein [Hypoxylon sp. FL1284]|nr:Metallo-dependent phosphatase-like protein [Hypoxylon sp. FL1284]
MSNSFLTSQDIESWSAKPTTHGAGAGFIARFFTTVHKSIALLTSILTTTDQDESNQCRNEFERFFLWGQGLSILDGDLDEALSRSKEVRFCVLSLLLRLGTAVHEGLSRNLLASPQILEQCESLETLLNASEMVLQEMESGESIRPNTPSDSDRSEVETADIITEMSIYIDCLLDLAPVLENPALDIDVDDSGEPPTQIFQEAYTVSSGEALIYCRKIRDRFEALPKYLVERLAEANVLRAEGLREIRSQRDKPETTSPDDITDSLFSTADHRLTETTGSTSQPSSTFSSVFSLTKRPKVEIPILDDDYKSVASFASFSTAESSAALGRPRVPPMPEDDGNGFICPICTNNITDVKSRKEWKKHVFDDLMPYICTVEECEHTTTLYNHSGSWVQHELSHQSHPSTQIECPFCTALYQSEAMPYYRHVSDHLREVSLSVLPQSDDKNDDFDTDTDADGRYLEPLISPVFLPIETGETDQETAAATSKVPAHIPDNPTDILLDTIIERLIKFRNTKPKKAVRLSSEEVLYLSNEARGKILTQPILLELEGPITIMGDIHGQYHDLLRALGNVGFPPEVNYLLLGNYVGFGSQSIETLCLLLAYKIKYPDNFFLLRGNHESRAMAQKNGFYEDCERKYGTGMWFSFLGLFDCLPLAAVIDDKIFCTHGGLSPDLKDIRQIRRVIRPTEVPDSGLIHDLLWSNPDKDVEEWGEGDSDDRAPTFGPKAIDNFLQKNDFDLIVRGNQVVEHGYEFFRNRTFVTLFTASRWKREHDNAAAVMSISESLLCSFQVCFQLPLLVYGVAHRIFTRIGYAAERNPARSWQWR